MRRRSGPNYVLLGAGILFTLLFVALLGIGFNFNPRELPDAMTGKQVPAFRLTDLDGNTVQVDALKGKPVVLNFWSTWCVPCKQEHPVLLEAAKLYPEVQFFGVIYQDEPEPIRQYLARNGTAYPHLIDPGSRTAINMGVAGVPETYFIDRNGIIQNKANFPLWSEYIGEQIERIMGDKP